MRLFFPSAAEILTDHAANGEGLIAWQLLCGLAHRGHDIVACTKRTDLECAAPFDIIELEYTSSFDTLEPLAYARASARMLAKCDPRGFDIVHWLFPDAAPSYSPAYAHGRPLVVGPIVQRWDGNARWWPLGFVLARAMQPWVTRRTHALLDESVTILTAEPSAVARLSPALAAKTEVLPFGVDVYGYRHKPIPSASSILYVGNLVASKRVKDLIAALQEIRNHIPEVQLVIAGDGPCEGALRHQARALGVEDATRFIGAVPHHAVGPLMEDASLVCLPAVREAFGMVLVEAMACGRVIVAANEGGPAWIVEEGAGGRLVPPRDPHALAKVITTLLSDRSALERGGCANRMRAEAIFDLGRILERLEGIYEGAAQSPTTSIAR